MKYWIFDKNNNPIEVKYSAFLHPIRAWKDFKETLPPNYITTTKDYEKLQAEYFTKKGDR